MFLQIFEDFSLSQTTTPPTPDDLQNINDGILTVIKFENGRFYECDGAGDWTALPEVNSNGD